jgi:hypothetical protein
MAACSSGVEVPIRHQDIVFLDGTRLLLIDKRTELDTATSMAKPLVVAYDVGARRELWRAVVSAEHVIASDSGKFATVIDRSSTPDTLVGVLELGAGQFRDLRLAIPDPKDLGGKPSATAISDDGSHIASVLDYRLHVWETAKGGLVHQQTFGDDGAVGVQFVGGGLDLSVQLKVSPAFDESRADVVVLSLVSGTWQIEKRLSNLRAFDWTTRGLLFATDQGVTRYDRRKVELVAAGLVPVGARFSRDGRYVGYRSATGKLEVYDLDARKVVLTSQWRPYLAFHGKHVTAMSNGELWRGDLEDGTSRVLQDFGAAAQTVKIPFFGGTTTNTSYDYALSPDGTLLYLTRNGEARVLAIEEP